MTTEDMIALAKATAAQHGLFPEIVCAVAEQESHWDTWAVNPEPHYVWLWDLVNKKPFRKITPEERRSEIPPDDFPAPAWVDRDAEWWCQSMSWGLGQVMGAVARECGFKGKFLTELCDPHVNLEILCLHLQRKFTAAEGNVEKALLLYNGGGNQKYPAEVLARADRYK